MINSFLVSLSGRPQLQENTMQIMRSYSGNMADIANDLPVFCRLFRHLNKNSILKQKTTPAS